MPIDSTLYITSLALRARVADCAVARVAVNEVDTEAAVYTRVACTLVNLCTNISIHHCFIL